MSSKEKMGRKVFMFTQGQIDMVSRIQNKHSMSTFVEALRYCITMTHSKEFRDYIMVQKERAAIDPTQKALTKADAQFEAAEQREKRKLQKEYDNQATLCTALEGTISLDSVGLPVCTYKVYSMNGPWIVDESEITDPLNMLNPETVERQYTGLLGETGPKGRAAIEAARVKISANKV